MDQDRLDTDYEGSRILADAIIQGNIKSDQNLWIEGCIKGNINVSKRVIVRDSGVIDGDVTCEELYTDGRITGNVCANRKAVAGATAIIEGGLVTACLEITPGAKLLKGLKLKSASK